MGVGAGEDEEDKDDGVGEEVEKKETARKVHPRRRRHDEGAEDDGNHGDGSVVGSGPATTNPTSLETGQRDEIPSKTVGDVGGETNQKWPGGATEAET